MRSGPVCSLKSKQKNCCFILALRKQRQSGKHLSNQVPTLPRVKCTHTHTHTGLKQEVHRCQNKEEVGERSHRFLSLMECTFAKQQVFVFFASCSRRGFPPALSLLSSFLCLFRRFLSRGDKSTRLISVQLSLEQHGRQQTLPAWEGLVSGRKVEQLFHFLLWLGRSNGSAFATNAIILRAYSITTQSANN